MDIHVENHGSIFLFRPETDTGREWLAEHTDGQWWGGALVVEPRYARDLADGAMAEGLEIS
jgi:hypothetical protein